MLTTHPQEVLAEISRFMFIFLNNNDSNAHLLFNNVVLILVPFTFSAYAPFLQCRTYIIKYVLTQISFKVKISLNRC